MTAWIVRMSDRDERLLHALVRRRHRHVDRALRLITRLGDPASTIGITVLLLVAGKRSAGARAAFALAASHLAVQAIKRTVHRPRPHMPSGIDSLVRAPDRFSFPSGHAAASLSVALPLAVTLPKAAAGPVLGLAALVGISRSYLGVHYPGDVLAGWTLAAVAAALSDSALGLLPHRRPDHP